MKAATPTILAVLFSLTAARAAQPGKAIYLSAPPSAVCASGEALSQRMRGCEDNRRFLEQAKTCMSNFQNMRKGVSAQMGGNFDHSGNAAQTADFQAKDTDSKEAIKAHAFLIATAEIMMREMDDYFDRFDHPDEIQAPDNDPDAYDAEVMQASCYREPAEGLDDIMDDLEDQIKEMKAALTEEKRHAKISESRQQHLGTDSLSGAARSTRGQGGAAAKTGKSARDNSRVTGVEKDMKGNEIPVLRK